MLYKDCTSTGENLYKANKAKIIQSKFRNSMSAPCLRPLFLSVFIEVWLSKEGRTNLTSTEELLSEYNESNQLMESVDILHRVFGY